MAPTPVLLPWKSHGRRSLVGCSPGGREESDTTERLHFHFSLSCIGEGNGIPLQCSCLENLRDGGAWWTAIYGVAQSWTWLKQLSSSSRSISFQKWNKKDRDLSHISHITIGINLWSCIFCLTFLNFGSLPSREKWELVAHRSIRKVSYIRVHLVQSIGSGIL